MIHFPIGDHKRYYISEYQNIDFPIPDFGGQMAIVSVLTAMDSEISTLKSKHNKVSEVNLGMMQQLLTGKIRQKSTREINQHVP